MRLSQLYRMSDDFLGRVLDQSEMHPSIIAFQAMMSISRSIRLIKEHLNNAFLSKERDQFYKCIDALEEECDEAIYQVDLLRQEDKRKHMDLITEGEELLSHYVIAYNMLIEKAIKTKYKDSQ
ncbi:MAG: hypothetical protein RIF33_18375 [Cyclobacteriaceae bacterium]